MAATFALLVTLGRPDLVRSMVCIDANYYPDGIELDIDPDDPVIGMIADAYGAASPDGPDHFPAVLEKTLAMFGSEPTLTTADLSGVTRRTLVIAGDDDAVDLSHTCSLFEAISPDLAQLAIVPELPTSPPLKSPSSSVASSSSSSPATSPRRPSCPIAAAPRCRSDRSASVGGGVGAIDTEEVAGRHDAHESAVLLDEDMADVAVHHLGRHLVDGGSTSHQTNSVLATSTARTDAGPWPVATTRTMSRSDTRAAGRSSSPTTTAPTSLATMASATSTSVASAANAHDWVPSEGRDGGRTG